MGAINRRDFLGTGALAAGALAFGPGFWRTALAAPAPAGPGPYGAPGPPDANGISVPSGFRVREIARAGQPVEGTAYPWHIFPDGQSTYALNDGGWVLVSNSESVAASGAGSSAIRFDANGEIVDAYRILAGTNVNCAGGRTPWGTWLSCEEHDGGQVWECDPLGRRVPLNRPAMGLFKHEAAAVDPIGKRLYLTEDSPDGCLYRFTPTVFGDLSSGTLEVMVGSPGGAVTWVAVPDPSGITSPTRRQVAAAAHFNGGEGVWYDSGFVYFTSKGDSRVWSYDTRTQVLDVLYDGKATPEAGLTGLDNITVTRSGDLFGCEDNGEAEFSVGIITREREAARFLTVSGPNHSGSELAGVIFDPSGTRMYFSSQRAFGAGAVYEVTGPFRTDPPAGAATGSGDPEPLDPDAPGTAGGPADSPGLKISAAKRATVSTLLRRGIVVNVSIKQPGRVTLALRTADLDSETRATGAEEPKTVTLATAERTYKRAGRYKVLLKPRGKVRNRLKGHGTLTARYTVQARGPSGFIQVANRRVRVAGVKRR
jgi:uncharacterized protein